MIDVSATRRGVLRTCVLAAMAQVRRCGRGHCLPLPTSAPLTRLRRGISIHTAYNWPAMTSDGRYAWPPFAAARRVLNDATLGALRRVGFDFIRLTVNPRIFIAHLGKDRWRDLQNGLMWGVNRILAHGFNVIVDLHSIRRDPENRRDALVTQAAGGIAHAPAGHVTALVQRMAAMLTTTPPGRVALELWNEPDISAGNAGAWDKFQQGLHRSARAVAPHLTLVVAGIHTSYEGLMSLDGCAYDDGNTYVTFHYYDPTPFTLQGMVASPNSVDPIRFFAGVPYPTSSEAARRAAVDARRRLDSSPGLANADRAAIADVLTTRADYLAERSNAAWTQAKFAEVNAWARDNRVAPGRVLVGEFGAMRPGVNPADRLRWLADVRRAADDAGFPWCLWQLESPVNMGLLDAKGKLDGGMLAALRLASG